MSSETDFENRINNAICDAIVIGYRPQILITKKAIYGTLSTVKSLINSKKITDGFTNLWELNRLDLSLENIIQEIEWKDLFTEDERIKAKKRLRDYGFII